MNIHKKRKNEWKKSIRQVRHQATGITLIALVVTLVVLLILASVTITFVLGENGIINMAQRAAEKTNQAVINEQQDLKNITDQMQEYLNDSSGENNGNSTKVSDLIGKPADQDKNQDVKDEYGNKITIPAGFTVVPDGTDNVEYNYSGDKKPNVQDGIVVQDSEENQFVWIPVGEIINKDGSKTTIELARYTFDVGTYDSTTKTCNGTGEIVNKVIDGSELKTSSTATYGFLEELASSTTYENAKAKDIEGFKTNVKAKGGYYLARYEMSQNEGKLMSKEQQTPYFEIQQHVPKIAQKMYDSKNFMSDLTNSYAWDTAIIFIQNYGGREMSDYSKHVSKNIETPGKTGISGDKACNIYDLASNYQEWTTETMMYDTAPCVYRGGTSYPKKIGTPPGYRGCVNTIEDRAFRVIIYIQ